MIKILGSQDIFKNSINSLQTSYDTKFNQFYVFSDLHQRVDSVKEENLKLRSENQVLGQYIENLMSASSVFQSTNNPNIVKKSKN